MKRLEITVSVCGKHVWGWDKGPNESLTEYIARKKAEEETPLRCVRKERKSIVDRQDHKRLLF